MALYNEQTGERLSKRAEASARSWSKRRRKKSHKSIKRDLSEYGYTERKPRKRKRKRKAKPATKPKPAPKPETKKPKTRKAPTRYDHKQFWGPAGHQADPRPNTTKIVQRKLRKYRDGHVTAVYEVARFFKDQQKTREGVVRDLINTEWVYRHRQAANKFLQQYKLKKSDPDFFIKTDYGSYMQEPRTKKIVQPFKRVEKDLRDLEEEDFADEECIPQHYLDKGYFVIGVRIHCELVTGKDWQDHYRNKVKWVNPHSKPRKGKQKKHRS